MSDQLRTFIGVPIVLPSRLKSLLREIGDMGRAVRAVDAESTHITVKFLGNTPADSLVAVQKVLETVAVNEEPFELELVGIGAFPHWGRPMVTWAGVRSREPLATIAERLERELEPLGFPAEKREYHPHLTLARIKAKPPAELKQLAERSEEESFGHQLIDRIVFYQSELQRTGPIYTPIATVMLGAKNSE